MNVDLNARYTFLYKYQLRHNKHLLSQFSVTMFLLSLAVNFHPPFKVFCCVLLTNLEISQYHRSTANFVVIPSVGIMSIE